MCEDWLLWNVGAKMISALTRLLEPRWCHQSYLSTPLLFCLICTYSEAQKEDLSQEPILFFQAQGTSRQMTVDTKVPEHTVDGVDRIELDPNEERALVCHYIQPCFGLHDVWTHFKVWRLDLFFLTIGFLGYAFKYLDQTNIVSRLRPSIETAF